MKAWAFKNHGTSGGAISASPRHPELPSQSGSAAPSTAAAPQHIRQLLHPPAMKAGATPLRASSAVRALA